jgi:small-conductance mechanosensitive channel
MALHDLSLEPLIIPLIFIAGGFLLGMVFEKIILKEIKKIVARTSWEGDELIVNALHGMTIFWFVSAGVYWALRHIQMSSGLLDFLQKALLVLVILSVTLVLAKILAGFVNLYSKKVGGALLSTSMFANLTKIFVFIIGILIVLQSLGISVTPILTALGVGGLAVALALQETLSNLFAGIQIIVSKQIKPGNYVKLAAGEEGYVTDITWRYTTIRSLPNNMIIIPNAKLASAVVTNYHCPEKEMAVVAPVGVSYDSDLEKVERVTIEVARDVMKDVPGGVPTFEPFIRYHTFNDFSINFNVILRGREFVDQHLIRHEFIKRLHRRYKAEGIVIPFPIRTIRMQEKHPKKGDQT